MTFSVSRDYGGFEWAGNSLDSVFAQRSNIFRLSHWRMIFDIVRFNQFALDLLSGDPVAESRSSLTIGEYLIREGYSSSFRDNYLIPMTACVWSTGPDKCALEFPAVTLVRFMWNHHLLSTIAHRAPWLTIVNKAKTYIETVLHDFPEESVHLSSPVRRLSTSKDHATLHFGDGQVQTFDQVILACHGDQAMDIISSTATQREKEILSAFQTTPNMAYLHSDLSVSLLLFSIRFPSTVY